MSQTLRLSASTGWVPAARTTQARHAKARETKPLDDSSWRPKGTETCR